MNELNDTTDQSQALISRRSVVRAAAWSAPAIAMSVAVPAASASAYTVNVSSIQVSAGINQPAWPEFVPIIAQTPSKSGTTTTIDLKAPASNWFSVGQNLTISGLSGTAGTAYNGTFPITAITGTTVSFTNSATAVAIANTPIVISSVTFSAPTVTVNTSTNHGFTVGQWVDIGGNSYIAGTWQVQAVNTLKQFTFNVPSSLTVSTTIPTVSLKTGTGSVTTSAASGSTPALATFTTLTNHGLAAGQMITISGATPSGYNRTYVVYSVPSTTTFKVATTQTGDISAGTLNIALATGVGAVQKTSEMYAWLGANPYNPPMVTWVDNVGPYSPGWPTGLMTVTVTFQPTNSSEGNALPDYPALEIWKLPSNLASTGLDASLTAPTGASEIAKNDQITAYDGIVWKVLTYDKRTASQPYVVLQSLSGYTVTSVNSTVYLPRVGLRVPNVTNYNASEKPFKFTYKWEARPAGRSGFTTTNGISF
jgi:hypothetical protein